MHTDRYFKDYLEGVIMFSWATTACWQEGSTHRLSFTRPLVHRSNVVWRFLTRGREATNHHDRHCSSRFTWSTLNNPYSWLLFCHPTRPADTAESTSAFEARHKHTSVVCTWLLEIEISFASLRSCYCISLVPRFPCVTDHTGGSRRDAGFP